MLNNYTYTWLHGTTQRTSLDTDINRSKAIIKENETKDQQMVISLIDLAEIMINKLEANEANLNLRRGKQSLISNLVLTFIHPDAKRVTEAEQAIKKVLSTHRGKLNSYCKAVRLDLERSKGKLI